MTVLSSKGTRLYIDGVELPGVQSFEVDWTPQHDPACEGILTCHSCWQSNSTTQELPMWLVSPSLIVCVRCLCRVFGYNPAAYLAGFWTRRPGQA